MSVLYVFLAILMFGIMITVHEAGHFFAARLNRIPVREFAIGFGPKLLAWKSRKHRTDFSLRMIPMGGFCAFYGEDDGSEEAKANPDSFNNHSVWRRLITILAGPVMNLLLALLVAFAFYLIGGVPKQTGPAVTTIVKVNADSPAEHAGLQAYDRLLKINGVDITDNASEAIAQASTGEGKELEILVNRPGKGEITVKATPLFDREARRYMIGVSLQMQAPSQWVRAGLGETFTAAWNTCVNAGASILNALRNLVFKGEGINEMTGFVGITQTIVQTTRESQLQGYLYLMCLISVNLALFNLLPIPGLDGSRMLFLIVEAIRGKPFKREGYVHAIGMLLLFALMIWINIRDILRLF